MVTLDETGRLLLPEPLRKRMGLSPGDALELQAEGGRITLRPVRPKAVIKKERGVWVCQGEPANISLPEFIDRQRKKRIRELLR